MFGLRENTAKSLSGLSTELAASQGIHIRQHATGGPLSWLRVSPARSRGSLPDASPRGLQRSRLTGGNTLEHRKIDYTVGEEEPGRWRWKIHLGLTAATVISDAQFPTPAAAVAACLKRPRTKPTFPRPGPNGPHVRHAQRNPTRGSDMTRPSLSRRWTPE